jgi:hypothetical protein
MFGVPKFVFQPTTVCCVTTTFQVGTAGFEPALNPIDLRWRRNTTSCCLPTLPRGGCRTSAERRTGLWRVNLSQKSRCHFRQVAASAGNKLVGARPPPSRLPRTILQGPRLKAAAGAVSRRPRVYPSTSTANLHRTTAPSGSERQVLLVRLAFERYSRASTPPMLAPSLWQL